MLPEIGPVHDHEAFYPPKKAPLAYFRGVCAVVSLCAVVPGCSLVRGPAPVTATAGIAAALGLTPLSPVRRRTPGPAAPRGQTGDSRHITWPATGIESLCDITPLIRGVMTHDNGKDHFPARSGVYFRGWRARSARMGPAGAARPGRAGPAVAGAAARPGPGRPQPGRDQAGRSPAGTRAAAVRPRHRAAFRGISQRGPRRAEKANG